MENMLKRFGYLKSGVAAHIASRHADDPSWDFWNFLKEAAENQDEMKAQTERFKAIVKREQMRINSNRT